MKSDSNDLSFFSDDRRFGLQIMCSPLRHIISLCQKANNSETGGIFLGTYSPDHSCAIVSQTSDPPNDSEAGHSWFYRGVKGMKTLLHKVWKTNREYYLGEWHYHPYSSPDPSTIDINELCRISKNKSYSCPEPVMLIIGGDPFGQWSVRAFVFPNGIKIELHKVFEQ